MFLQEKVYVRAYLVEVKKGMKGKVMSTCEIKGGMKEAGDVAVIKLG